MKKREPVMSPAGLIRSTMSKRQTSWDLLSDFERKYISSVVVELNRTPGAKVYRVADAIISELSLDIHQHTMVRILKGLMNDKA